METEIKNINDTSEEYDNFPDDIDYGSENDFYSYRELNKKR